MTRDDPSERPGDASTVLAGGGRVRTRWGLVGGLVALAAASFGLFVAMTAFGVGAPASAGPDVDSRSALGHAPLVRLLTALGVPTSVARWFPGRRAPDDALLVVLEPQLEAGPVDGADGLRAARDRRGPTLLVLPKRRLPRAPGRSGEADDAEAGGDPEVAAEAGGVGPVRDGWVGRTVLVPRLDVDRVLARAGTGLRTVRRDATGPFAVGSVGVAPTLVAPVQLLAPDDRVTPLVACPEGVLLGLVENDAGGELYVLSDPDVVAAHGLRAGRNPELVVGWVDRLRPPGGAVVVDAASQGRGRAPSLLRELFGPDLRLATLSALAAALAAVWLGARRFGAPRPAASPFAGRTRPVVEYAAELALDGGHTAHALERYLEVHVAAVAADVHAPPGLPAAERRAWVDRASAARGRPETVAALTEAVAAADGAPGPSLDVARRIHAWRSAFAHGPRLDP